ncbi:MAG: Cof-type HAD-IIB family hydrolase [Lactovum sp.]
MIKLIASDMDGTLVSSNHRISKENAQAIKEAQENGAEFIISTGRSYEDSYQQVKEADIKCKYLVMNGSELRDDKGEIVFKVYLEQDIVRMIVNDLLREDFCVELYTTAGTYALGTTEACKLSVATRINNFYPEQSIETIYETVESHFLFKELNRVDSLEELFGKDYKVGKIIIFSRDISKVENLRESIPKQYPVNATGSFAINLEITHPLADKGKAICRYAESKGIVLDEIMTIGDSYNDMTMLDSAFGYTVAMGNAIEEIKKIAKYVTDTNDNHGVGKAIKKFMKIK